MQNYYNITSDMPKAMMLSIAAENLETQKKLVEEQRRAGLVRPLHIWISRWVGEKLENQTRKKRHLWTFKCAHRPFLLFFCIAPVLSVQSAAC